MPACIAWLGDEHLVETGYFWGWVSGWYEFDGVQRLLGSDDADGVFVTVRARVFGRACG